MLGKARSIRLILPLLACACSSWHPVALAPARSGLLPDHVRIVRTSGKRVEVHGALVKSDSVAGIRGNGTYIAISRDSVASVEEPRMDRGRTLALVGSLGTLFVLLGWGAFSIRD
jgi:hypothetical protein